VLKDDKRPIFTAASHAQRAVDLLHDVAKAAETAAEAA
jgi:antirestriction protein ArdC